MQELRKELLKLDSKDQNERKQMLTELAQMAPRVPEAFDMLRWLQDKIKMEKNFGLPDVVRFSKI